MNRSIAEITFLFCFLFFSIGIVHAGGDWSGFPPALTAACIVLFAASWSFGIAIIVNAVLGTFSSRR